MENPKYAELHALIKGMNLPEHRKTSNTPENIRWLSRNIGIRNGTHANYAKARDLIVSILKELNMLSNKEEKQLMAQ